MLISFLEIQNFRKLKSVRIDLSSQTTVLVGANNSGKTSAMVALVHFLIEKKNFSTNDFTLSSWDKINSIGERWESSGLMEDWDINELLQWEDVLPCLDVWMDVGPKEIYHVIHLFPSTKWAGGLIGVRLRVQPEKIIDFYRDYINSRQEAKQTIIDAQALKKAGGEEEEYSISLWPKNMCEFLERRLNRYFTVTPYNLDPTLLNTPVNGIAMPQQIPADSLPIDQDPFKKLLRIDKIDAHRGFSNLTSKSVDADGNEFYEGEKGKLSEQLRAYYKKHIDPSTMPDASDVEALEAIHKAQKEFDKKLSSGFKNRFEELEGLGYPGVADPRLEISTKIKPVDGLNHASALKYVVSSYEESSATVAVTLPEYYNGLGYQNLISMVFKLMSFRDDWMQVGKVGRKLLSLTSEDKSIAPLHLVLVEEPEVHLHVQVQQVFIRKAYEILRSHDELKNNKSLSTQLIVSTHSSHIAHECDFSNLRYFRRRPALNKKEVPISTVINLSEVFGTTDETARFVSRYIKSTHCDLFFADGAILVEGPSERMLVPHFIREHFPILNHSYITLLEIGGSHAHRLRSLIDHLGLTTLIISDLDSAEGSGYHKSVQPRRNEGQITRNNVLKTWVPEKNSVDDLLDLPGHEKETCKSDQFYSVRSAYQIPIKAKLNDEDTEGEVISTTFEDAFVLENIQNIKSMNGEGFVELFKEDIKVSKTVDELCDKLYVTIRDNQKLKAEFALNILFHEDPKNLNVPLYIKEGLEWLSLRIKIKQKDSLIPAAILIEENKP